MLRDEEFFKWNWNMFVLIMRCNFRLQFIPEPIRVYLMAYDNKNNRSCSIRTDYLDAFTFRWLPLICFLRSIDGISEVYNIYQECVCTIFLENLLLGLIDLFITLHRMVDLPFARSTSIWCNFQQFALRRQIQNIHDRQQRKLLSFFHKYSQQNW